jgi:hypothetical protein
MGEKALIRLQTSLFKGKSDANLALLITGLFRNRSLVAAGIPPQLFLPSFRFSHYHHSLVRIIAFSHCTCRVRENASLRPAGTGTDIRKVPAAAFQTCIPPIKFWADRPAGLSPDHNERNKEYDELEGKYCYRPRASTDET